MLDRMSIPERSVPFRGCPMEHAPRWLQPYLDCVDGAVLIAATFRPGGRETVEVALFRGGEQVGQVLVEVEPRA